MLDLSAPQEGELGEAAWFSELLLAALAGAFTGGILVATPEGERVAFFRGGHPVHTGGRGFQSNYLGEILLEAQQVTAEQLQTALEQQNRDPNHPPLGACLVARGADPNDIKRAVQQQTLRRFAELVALTQGRWQSAPGESARVRDLGVPVDGWLTLTSALVEHASDLELKAFSNELLGKSVQLVPTGLTKIEVFQTAAENVLRYLTKPRKPDQLERAVGNRRQVRAILKILDRANALEQGPASRGIPIPKATLLKGVSFPSSSSSVPTSSPGTESTSTGPSSSAPSGTSSAPSSSPSSSSSARADARQPASGLVGASSDGGSRRRPAATRDITADLTRRMEEAKLLKEVRAFAQGLGEKNHFEVLGVDRNTDAAALRKTYTLLAKRFHPDAVGSDADAELSQGLKEISARINEAYEVLSDKESRAEYVALLDDKRFLGDARKAARVRDADVKGQMGLVMLRKRDFSRARELFSQAMELDPDNAMHKAHFAWALFADPRSERASATEKAYILLLDAVRVAGKDSTIRTYLGQVLKAQDRAKEALTHFKEAVAIDPKNAEAQREIRLLTQRLEKSKETQKKPGLGRFFKKP
ncbi:MAG: DnaJ domain-containing protein [Deltaproteobacteria bacterium]|nr:DnaJ domain-containing protein [Deltaproteobacteria bacterium]